MLLCNMQTFAKFCLKCLWNLWGLHQNIKGVMQRLAAQHEFVVTSCNAA